MTGLWDFVFLRQLRNHLERRLHELEPLPEQLRNSEQKLLEATEKLLTQERRFADQTKVISDLSTKVSCPLRPSGHAASATIP